MMGTQSKLKPVDQPDGQPFEAFIDKSEVGRRLQMRPRTIDDWMTRGLLPYYKVNRSVRFLWSEVQEHLMQTCRVCPMRGNDKEPAK